MRGFLGYVYKYLFFLLITFVIYGCSATTPKEDVTPFVNDFEQFLLSIDPESASRFTNYLQLQQLFDSLEAAEAGENIQKRISLLAEIANKFRLTGNYYEGIFFYRIAISLLNEHEPLQRTEFYHGLAAIYYELYLHIENQQHFLDSASKIADMALRYAEIESSPKDFSDVLNLIGAIKIQKGKYSEAIQQLNKSYSIKRTLKADQSMAVLTNLSYAHYQLQSYDTALFYIREAYKIAVECEDIIFAVNSLELLSDIYLAIGDTATANSLEHDRQQLIRQDDHMVRLLVMKHLHHNYEHRHDYKLILGLTRDKYYFVRLSRILLLGIFLLFILLLTIFKMLHQSGKLHDAEIELAREKERAAELQVRNVTLELEEKRQKEQRLNEDLDYKQGLLTSKLLHLSMINEFLNQLKEDINQSKDPDGKVDKSHYFEKVEMEISKQLKGNIWDEFEMLYATGNNSFIEKLMAVHPDLTLHEKRLSYLIMSGYTTKEIANILSKTYRSVEMARHRLRTKLGLDKNTTLEAYFSRLINQSS